MQEPDRLLVRLKVDARLWRRLRSYALLSNQPLNDVAVRAIAELLERVDSSRPIHRPEQSLD